MCRLVSRHLSLPFVFVALIGALALMLSAPTALGRTTHRAGVAPLKKKAPGEGPWSLAEEFPSKKKNPVPDRYADKDVWTYIGGLANTPGSYHRLKKFFGARQIEEHCGVQGFEEFLHGRSALTRHLLQRRANG